MIRLSIVLAVVFIAGALGKSVPESRMIGGQDAVPGQFPFVASVMHYGYHICVGSIVKSNWVLTTARWTYYAEAEDLSITVGAHLLSSGGHIYEVLLKYEHPNYVPLTLENDLSLIKSYDDFYLTETVQPIAIGYTFLEHDVVTIAIGWDNINLDNVQWLKQTTITNEYCASLISDLWSDDIFDSTICVLSDEGEGACGGSGGAPILVGNSIVGVFSWNEECAAGSPDVYVRLSTHRDWIDTTLMG